MDIKGLSLIIALAPLLGSIITGIGGRKLNQRFASLLTICLVGVSFLGAVWMAKLVVVDGNSWHGVIYHWVVSGSYTFNVGFLVDNLSSVMMLLVTFVSLLVHIYSVGYMEKTDDFNRFFSYVSLFTFSMLMLLLADNFAQLFFGWEAVGLVSYLLIGFWFYKQSAANGSLKAFIVNRIGDFGFILGLAAILDYTGTLSYSGVFAQAATLKATTLHVWPHFQWGVLTMICVLLFIGAMGKSAQVPLHVWLPESMEGPTPISALIHAATMVTAGVYMVARMSPLFTLSIPASSMVLILGATGALFLGILAFTENDIKRVIAFSTMSQLGYMMAADGVMAYPAGIFHLLMHGCFKALLFLAAGSVIIAMHHEQDLRKMGNLKKYLPWTYATFLVGALALSAIPPLSGFYSKDPIIDAVGLSTLPGAQYAYWCLLVGGFVTGYYIFRAFFMAFHGKERMSDEVKSHLHETPWTMRIALVALAIPSIFAGFFLAKDFLYSPTAILNTSVTIPAGGGVLGQLAMHFHSAWDLILESFTTLPFWFAVCGVVLAWFNVLVRPQFPAWCKKNFPWLYVTLKNQFGFDLLYLNVISKGVVKMSQFFYSVTDVKLIDSSLVEGTGRRVTGLAALVRRLQSGYLYHYVLVMVLGVVVFSIWLLLR
jgi:NADH-quinone oxidoreductase subunit L